MKLLRNLAILLAMAVLAGCAGVPERNPETREVSELLDYYGRLAALPPDEQQRAYQEAKADFERQSGDMQRLRLALALSLPRAPWRDDAQVLQLVESIAETPGDRPSPRRNFALAIHKLVGERLRLLREEQRKADDAQQKLHGQLAERQRQLREEHRKAEDLQEKLDALLAIDRDMRLKMRRR